MRAIFGSFLVAMLIPVGASLAGGESRVLSGVIRDVSGAAVGDILLHARSDQSETVVSQRTAEDGSYALVIPDGSLVWRIAIDERELIERGYFCFPDFIWEPKDPIEIPELTTVPLRPELTVIRSTDGVTCLQMEFDWLTGLNPSVLRQYRIERSLDMKTWEEVLTVALACPPMMVFDETQTEVKTGYYRAVEVEAVIIQELNPEDFEFIADPAFGWEGEPVLVFQTGEPLPDSPVMAPTIFVRNGE